VARVPGLLPVRALSLEKELGPPGGEGGLQSLEWAES
jgi:hypothetical protein